MPLVVTCGGCKKKLKIPDTLVGKSLKCPGCARKLTTSAKPNPATNGAVAQPQQKAAAKTPATKLPSPKRADGSIKKASATPAIKKPSPVKSGPPPAPTPAAKPKPAAKSSPAPVQAKPTPKPAPAPSPSPPPASKPSPAPARKPTPRRDDDDEEGHSKLVIFGGGGVAVALVVFAIYYLFFTGTPGMGTVSGTITLDGVPIENVNVEFHGIEPAGLRFDEPTDSSGTYKTSGDGLPAGNYKIVLTKTVTFKGEALPDGEEGDDESRNLFGDAYGTQEKSVLQLSVKIGSNVRDFEFTTKAGSRTKEIELTAQP